MEQMADFSENFSFTNSEANQMEIAVKIFSKEKDTWRLQG